MSAEIIEFFEARRARRFEAKLGRGQAGPQLSAECEFLFWAGASGTRYVHTVHTLVACPELPQCTYVLAYRAPSGERCLLAVGQLTGTVPSLNLAELRHRGARLGANEIHVHLLGGTVGERNRVVLDIKGAVSGLEAGAKVASAS